MGGNEEDGTTLHFMTAGAAGNVSPTPQLQQIMPAMSTQILAVQNFAQQMGMMGGGNAQPEVTVQVSFGPGVTSSLSPQMMMQQQSQVDSQPKVPTSMMQQQSQPAAQSEPLPPTEEHAMPCDFTKRPGPLKLKLNHMHAAGAAQRTAEHEQRVWEANNASSNYRAVAGSALLRAAAQRVADAGAAAQHAPLKLRRGLQLQEPLHIMRDPGAAGAAAHGEDRVDRQLVEDCAEMQRAAVARRLKKESGEAGLAACPRAASAAVQAPWSGTQARPMGEPAVKAAAVQKPGWSDELVRDVQARLDKRRRGQAVAADDKGKGKKSKGKPAKGDMDVAKDKQWKPMPKAKPMPTPGRVFASGYSG